jgi:hypothetical protein
MACELGALGATKDRLFETSVEVWCSQLWAVRLALCRPDIASRRKSPRSSIEGLVLGGQNVAA